MGIWGSRAKVTREEGGQFHCPRCEQQRSYVEKTVRRYFSLFSFSLFPVEPAGGYVECANCRATFSHEALRYDPDADRRAFQAGFESALLNSMILMMVSDGAIDDEEVASVCRIYEQLSGRSLSPQAVRARAADIRHGGDLQVYLADTASQLSAEGKDIVMRALGMIAAADGTVAPEEDALLARAARVLGVAPVAETPVLEEAHGA